MTQILPLSIAPVCLAQNGADKKPPAEQNPAKNAAKCETAPSVFIPARDAGPNREIDQVGPPEPAKYEDPKSPLIGPFDQPPTPCRGLGSNREENAPLSDNPLRTMGVFIGLKPLQQSPRLDDQGLDPLTPERRIEILTNRINALEDLQRRRDNFQVLADRYDELAQAVKDGQDGVFYGDYPALVESYRHMVSIPENSPEYEAASAEFEMLFDAYICEQTGMDMREIANLGQMTAQEGLEIFGIFLPANGPVR